MRCEICDKKEATIEVTYRDIPYAVCEGCKDFGKRLID